MTAFNREAESARPSGCWDLVTMFETQGGHEEEWNLNRDKRPSCLVCLVRSAQLNPEMKTRSEGDEVCDVESEESKSLELGELE